MPGESLLGGAQTSGENTDTHTHTHTHTHMHGKVSAGTGRRGITQLSAGLPADKVV